MEETKKMNDFYYLIRKVWTNLFLAIIFGWLIDVLYYLLQWECFYIIYDFKVFFAFMIVLLFNLFSLLHKKKTNLKIIIAGSTILGLVINIIIFLLFYYKFPYSRYIFEISFISVLLSILLYTLFWAISKKTNRATLIFSILVLLINLINLLKTQYTSEPFYLSDIVFAGNALKLLKLIDFSKFNYYLLKYFIEMFIFLVILNIFSSKNVIEITNNKIRLAILLVDIVLILLLFFPNHTMKDFYLKIFLGTDSYTDYNSYVSSNGYYFEKGLIKGLYGTHLNSIFTEPKDYDKNALNLLLKENTDDKNLKKIGKPNIIVIFSEAFWDITQLEEIEFNKDVVSNFHEIKEKEKFVNIVSPSYGGMSENVAFEMLTGGSMKFFPKGYIPIMSYYSRKESVNSPSIPKELKKNGYKTEIFFGMDYYNSQKAYLSMGFDNYTELGNITDDNFMNYIIDQLKNKKDKNVFYVIETIEGHMPFPSDKYDQYEIEITRSNFSDGDNSVIRSYAQAMYNADKSLKKVYDFIQEYNEPTVVVFLGDHLPFLGNEINLINDLDFFNTEDSLLNEYRKYNTQAVIFSNFGIDNLNLNNFLGNDLLLTSIINQLDIKLDDYYKWLYSTKEIMAASNRYITLDGDGEIYDTQNLNGKMKELSELKMQMQYKLFIDNKERK